MPRITMTEEEWKAVFPHLEKVRLQIAYRNAYNEGVVTAARAVHARPEYFSSEETREKMYKEVMELVQESGE